MRRAAALVLVILIGATACAADANEAVKPKTWRGGWGTGRSLDKTIACAKELRFNALMLSGNVGSIRARSEVLAKHGIESYYWLSPVVRRGVMAEFAQVMSPEDEKQLKAIRADKDPHKHGYQWGGEPLPGRHDVLRTRVLCFHRPEVKAHCRAKIKEVLEACPALTGIALDYFGYQNYRCCLCPHSMKLFEQYRLKHRDLPRDKALVSFSLETLVDTVNELSDYVREVRPGAKTSIHVYPTFLPEPLYGNRLNVDYCCQTVAWFFKPYWSDEKVRRYTRVVVAEQNRYFARQQGIPFVGVYVGRPYADKSPERLARELRIICDVDKTRSLSVCSFGSFVKHAEVRQTAKQALDGNSRTAEPR